ncbi:MAG: BamA/TamA family outer membrane protein, partial [Gemmatimonadales bacterium]
MKFNRSAIVFLLALSLIPVTALHSQSPAVADTAVTVETVNVIAGPEYAKGGLYTFFFGTGYRTLWTTPIRVEVLDLENFAGGLTFVELGGGEQTRSIEFRGADGREYNFRSINKDPSAVLPPQLRGTIADEIVQDQISAANPAGPLLAVPFLDAVGVLNAPPRFFVMPDSPLLGEHRAEFAGMLGTLEERPDEDPGYM